MRKAGNPTGLGRADPLVLPLPRLAGRPPAPGAAALAGQHAEQALPLEQVSRLLWHGLGLGRHGSGGRAAAAVAGRCDLELYACLPDGGYRYDAPAHALRRVTPHDCRALAGCAGRGSAPALLLVYVVAGADEDTGSEECGRLPASDPASVAARVAAYCAGAGLEARGADWVDGPLAALLRLPPGRRVALAQTVRALPAAH